MFAAPIDQGSNHSWMIGLAIVMALLGAGFLMATASSRRKR
jgi:hypothetical protein